MGDGHWQLEGSAAELYQRYLVPLITSKWAEVALNYRATVDLVSRQDFTDVVIVDLAEGGKTYTLAEFARLYKMRSSNLRLGWRC